MSRSLAAEVHPHDEMNASYAPGVFEGQHAANRTDRWPIKLIGVLPNQPVELRRTLPKRCNTIALCGPCTILGVLQRRHLSSALHKVSDSNTTGSWPPNSPDVYACKLTSRHITTL